MKHYFISVTSYSPKNRAHGRLQEHVNNYNHKVVDEDNLEEIISNIRIMKNAINEAYPRCQNIVLFEHRHEGFDHVGVYVDSNFNFSAAIVKGFMIYEPINVQ